MRFFGDVATLDRSGRQEGQSHSRRLERQTNGKIGMLLDFQRYRLAKFGGTAKIVAQPCGHIANPRRLNLLNAAGADELIELYIGYRSDQGQILAVLADDSMARGKGN